MSLPKEHNALRKAAWAHFKANGRHALPWRARQSPYRVLVSELMLQQTQVDRVEAKFNAFIKRFPTWKALAQAPLGEVYALWQGLGYNRRAKYLRDAAKRVVAHGKELPNDEAFLRSLPGVGPYTAGAVRAFAFGEPAPFIETNIRTAVIYHCFGSRGEIRDEEILAVLESVRPRRGKEARDWYAALMDYGAYLKRTGARLNSRSRGYAKQSRFEGSLRQVRGALLRELAFGGKTAATLIARLGREKADVERALSALIKEGLIEKKGRSYRLAS